MATIHLTKKQPSARNRSMAW